MAYEITVRHGFARAPLAGHARLVCADGGVLADPGGFDASFAGALETAFDRGFVEDATIAASLDQRHEFWKLRDGIPEAQTHEGGSIKHDVSVAVGDVPRLIAEATRAVEAFEPGARVCAFGHLGDGNIHFNVSQPLGADKAAFLERWDAMNEVVHGSWRVSAARSPPSTASGGSSEISRRGRKTPRRSRSCARSRRRSTRTG